MLTIRPVAPTAANSVCTPTGDVCELPFCASSGGPVDASDVKVSMMTSLLPVDSVAAISFTSVTARPNVIFKTFSPRSIVVTPILGGIYYSRRLEILFSDL